MEVFNQVNIDVLCGHCTAFIADLQDWSDRDLNEDDYEQSRKYFSQKSLIF